MLPRSPQVSIGVEFSSPLLQPRRVISAAIENCCSCVCQVCVSPVRNWAERRVGIQDCEFVSSTARIDVGATTMTSAARAAGRSVDQASRYFYSCSTQAGKLEKHIPQFQLVALSISFTTSQIRKYSDELARFFCCSTHTDFIPPSASPTRTPGLSQSTDPRSQSRAASSVHDVWLVRPVSGADGA